MTSNYWIYYKKFDFCKSSFKFTVFTAIIYIYMNYGGETMAAKDIIKSFWSDLIASNKSKLKEYFSEEALINIHNINKEITLEEYINRNCDHKEEWDGEIVRHVEMNGLSVVVTKINTSEDNLSYNVVSFMKIKDDKIISIDEYWAENGRMPMWD